MNYIAYSRSRRLVLLGNFFNSLGTAVVPFEIVKIYIIILYSIIITLEVETADSIIVILYYYSDEFYCSRKLLPAETFISSSGCILYNILFYFRNVR